MQRVVIAGGGVIGAATAYFLALRGVASTIVERRAIASGASGTAAGLLSPPSPADLREPWGELGRLSLGLHFEVAEALDGARRYGFEPVDTVLIARSPSERAAIVGTFGEEAWLDAAELTGRGKWFGSTVIGGVIRRGGAQLYPDQFTRSLVEAAGAEVVQGAVQGIVREGGAGTGCIVDGASLSARAVVLAMGPWTAEAAGWLDCPVPVTPLKGQILRLRVPAPPPAGFADIEGQYLVRKPNGLVYTGTTEEDAGFDETPTREAEERIMAWARTASPVVAGAEVLERTACLRPLAADNVPIVGAVPGAPGVYLATGHGRKGILLSLATAKALAELIVDGVATCVDMEPFNPARFVPGAVT